MKLNVSKKYLEVPVSANAVRKKLVFYVNGELVFDMDTTMDTVSPEYFQYINLERFIGSEIEIKCDPEVDFDLKETNEVQEDIKLYEKYRPNVHFSSRRGWINDPNGLYYNDGVYHMFFQYNPVSKDWGNMHWGHAVSRDLFHWEQLECALYPDELGTMFSGSAIVDTENVSGLKVNENDVVILYYTAAGNNSILSKEKKFTQGMAYSIDGGKTFEKYSKNPIIVHIEAENRDPKVIFCTEINQYLMALYLNDNRFTVYSSKNLLDWEPMHQVVLPEDSECPDMYPLYIDGDSEKMKWVFSGASDRYLIGDMTKGKFIPSQTAKKLHYGNSSYAAQSFSNTGERRIRIAWNTMRVPDSYFNCSMCIPTDMSLKNINGEDSLCLMPVSEIKDLYNNVTEQSDIIVDKGAENTVLLDCSETKAFDFDLLLSANTDSEFSISVFGLKIKFDVKENSIACFDKTMPICMDGDKIKLRMIADTLGLELFAGEGQAHMCMGFLCDYALNKLKIKADKGCIKIINCKTAGLNNINNK